MKLFSTGLISLLVAITLAPHPYMQVGIFSPGAFVPQQGTGSIVATGKTCVAINASGGGISCTWSANPAAGESIHCGVWAAGHPATFSISDNGSSGGNTYPQNGSNFVLTSISSFSIAIFDSFNITKSPSTTTLGNPGFTNRSIACFSTTGGVGAVDGATGTYQNNPTTSISVPVDPSGSADLAYFTYLGQHAPTPCSGCTQFGTYYGSSYIGIIYKVLSASSSQNITATMSSGYVGAIGGTDK